MSKITGIEMASIYAVNFEQSFDFYRNVIGLSEFAEMGPNACYFILPDERGVYLIGKLERNRDAAKKSRTTFAFGVESAFEMFEKLRRAGYVTIEDEPTDMGKGHFWFQAYDPSGNIIEFIGEK